MKELFAALLNGLLTGLRAVGADGPSVEHAWRIYLSALLGVFFAYTLVKLFDMDPLKAWPYIVGLIVGLVYGAYWHLRESD